LEQVDGTDLVGVTDNGHGITPELAGTGLGRVNGAWKSTPRKSFGGCILLAKDGHGRFKTVGFGGRVRWRSGYRPGNELREFSIAGSSIDLADVEVAEHVASIAMDTGTTVEARQVTMHYRSLDDAEAVAKDLALRFSLSLTGSS
jgi:hypothetical protein